MINIYFYWDLSAWNWESLSLGSFGMLSGYRCPNGHQPDPSSQTRRVIMTLQWKSHLNKLALLGFHVLIARWARSGARIHGASVDLRSTRKVSRSMSIVKSSSMRYRYNPSRTVDTSIPDASLHVLCQSFYLDLLCGLVWPPAVWFYELLSWEPFSGGVVCHFHYRVPLWTGMWMGVS